MCVIPLFWTATVCPQQTFRKPCIISFCSTDPTTVYEKIQERAGGGNPLQCIGSDWWSCGLYSTSTSHLDYACLVLKCDGSVCEWQRRNPLSVKQTENHLSSTAAVMKPTACVMRREGEEKQDLSLVNWYHTRLAEFLEEGKAVYTISP